MTMNYPYMIWLLSLQLLSIWTFSMANLSDLEKKIKQEFELIHYPGVPFGASEFLDSHDSLPLYDVAIIGGGMSGLAAAAALYREGIFNLQLFDENPATQEGPWVTYGYMKTLRSEKEEIGPALEIPGLTFQAWYTAQFGESKWKELDKIPNQLWMNYLSWYRQFLQIPVENDSCLQTLKHDGESFLLQFSQQGSQRLVRAKKVVLATGRAGFGGPFIPSFASHLTTPLISHIKEPIDFNALRGKKVGVVGSGSSAFDAAATALEHGAEVELLMRSAKIPCTNPFPYFHSQCFGLAYFTMEESWKLKIMQKLLSTTTAPPIASIQRVEKNKRFVLVPATSISHIEERDKRLVVQTNKGQLFYDFLILATGYQIKVEQQPELKQFFSHIKLWQDEYPLLKSSSFALGQYPYLGRSFEFLEKREKTAPYLKNLHCFNPASTLSHGIICRDITHISLGARRLAEGIAAHFLSWQAEEFLKDFEGVEPDFDPDQFSFEIRK